MFFIANMSSQPSVTTIKMEASIKIQQTDENTIDLSEDNDATAPLPSVFFKHKRERDEDLTGKENKRPALKMAVLVLPKGE